LTCRAQGVRVTPSDFPFLRDVVGHEHGECYRRSSGGPRFCAAWRG